jgi:hypothetical protein
MKSLDTLPTKTKTIKTTFSFFYFIILNFTRVFDPGVYSHPGGLHYISSGASIPKILKPFAKTCFTLFTNANHELLSTNFLLVVL